MYFSANDHPHRRYNPLTAEWVQVSPHRAKRPWQGQTETVAEDQKPEHDPNCYLCAGNERVGGEKNPNYQTTFVFRNDFSALLPDVPEHSETDELFRLQSEKGECRVICFSPRHDLTIPEMDMQNLVNVINTWTEQYTELGSNPNINYVQIFENKGSVMGASNPHPHGQIWAQSTVPDQPAKETVQQLAYYTKHQRTLLGDYLHKELEKKERILVENTHFVALVPFWAVWPFEAMIISKNAKSNLAELNNDEKADLMKTYKALTIMYDNLFEISFPYSAGIHQAPTDGLPHPEWHLHLHFYPPLLRSATVKKFMVGYEMLANPQRDITAEQAAERLRNVPKKHYKLRDNSSSNLL